MFSNLGMVDPKKRDLLDSMAAYDSSSAGGKIIYENYLSHDEITQGIARGIIKKGTFSVGVGPSVAPYADSFLCISSLNAFIAFFHIFSFHSSLLSRKNIPF